MLATKAPSAKQPINNYKFIIIILLICAAISRNAFGAPLKVAIDAGHGGRDTGAVNGSLVESHLVLKISHLLKERLEKNPTFTTYLTRSDNDFLSIMERTALVEGAQADIMVSIHANSSPEAGARGTEIYLRNVLPPDQDSLYLANRENQFAGKATPTATSRHWLSSQEDIKTIVQDIKRQQSLRHAAKLADHIVHHWPRKFKRERTSVRQAPFFVVTNVDIPAVLIEIGYVTNTADRQWLEDPETPQNIADALYRALTSYTAELTTTTAIR